MAARQAAAVLAYSAPIRELFEPVAHQKVIGAARREKTSPARTPVTGSLTGVIV